MSFSSAKINIQAFQSLRSVLLIGAGGLTGRWYSRLLLQDGLTLYVYDKNDSFDYGEELLSHERFCVVKNRELESGDILSKIDGLTLSPGVPLSQEIFLKAANMQNGPLLFSELEYCFERLSDKKWICITGTDGKSTVCSLVSHLFNENGLMTIPCGNFGLPFSQILVEKERFIDRKYLIAELSSYQLELSRNLKPAAAAYLNLAPDHLDRYDDFAHYGLTKWNIFSHMKEGLCLTNQKLLDSTLWPKESHPAEKIAPGCHKIAVDDERLISPGFIWQDEALYRRVVGNSGETPAQKSGQVSEQTSDQAPGSLSDQMKEKIVSLDELAMGGRHNMANTLFALEIYNYFHKNTRGAKEALCSYRGLAHRFERIDSNDGNLYINDSKATTTQATLAALSSVSAPLFLFLGGRSKGEDYGVLASAILEKKAQVFLYGENRNEIKEALEAKGVKAGAVFERLETVFQEAKKQSSLEQESNGDDLKKVTFLLSPASTSWDQYASFEKRGEYFRQLVQSLSG